MSPLQPRSSSRVPSAELRMDAPQDYYTVKLHVRFYANLCSEKSQTIALLLS